MIRAELELLMLTDAAGIKRELATALISEIKQDAIAADHAFEQEVSNLRNAKNEAVEALQQVLYNLRNA